MTDRAADVGEDDLEQQASRATDPNWSVAKIVAIVLGAPLVAFAVGALCVARLPIGEQHAFALGFHVMVPIWVTLGCTLPLARNGLRVLAACIAMGALCGLVLWLSGAP